MVTKWEKGEKSHLVAVAVRRQTHSPDCLLGWAAASKSRLLLGLFHPGRLRDCSPRQRLLVSGKLLGESWAEGEKSCLRAAAPSENWKSPDGGQRKKQKE